MSVEQSGFEVGDRVALDPDCEWNDEVSIRKIEHIYDGELIVEEVFDWGDDAYGLKFEGAKYTWDSVRFLPVVRMPVQRGEVRTMSATGGQKGSKPARFDLIPAGPLTILAEMYGRGAEKYEDRNWERGYDWSLSFAAMQRHAWQFWNGEDLDSETELPHLASVAFHALALLEFMTTHPQYDNRVKKETN